MLPRFIELTQGCGVSQLALMVQREELGDDVKKSFNGWLPGSELLGPRYRLLGTDLLFPTKYCPRRVWNSSGVKYLVGLKVDKRHAQKQKKKDFA